MLTKRKFNRKNIWLIIIPTILFGMLALIIHAGLIEGFEGWAYNETVEHMSPFLTNIMKFITHLGDSIMVIIICLTLIIIPKFRKTIAFPVSITIITSATLNFVLKNIFTRDRPNILRLINETSYSFPSGHAMNNAALYTMFALLIMKYIKGTHKKVILAAICVVLTIAIGYSRIYLGVHYAGDVVGGWLIGFAVSIFIFLIWDDQKVKEQKNNLQE